MKLTKDAFLRMYIFHTSISTPNFKWQTSECWLYNLVDFTYSDPQFLTYKMGLFVKCYKGGRYSKEHHLVDIQMVVLNI